MEGLQLNQITTQISILKCINILKLLNVCRVFVCTHHGHTRVFVYNANPRIHFQFSNTIRYGIIPHSPFISRSLEIWLAGIATMFYMWSDFHFRNVHNIRSKKCTKSMCATFVWERRSDWQSVIRKEMEKYPIKMYIYVCDNVFVRYRLYTFVGIIYGTMRVKELLYIAVAASAIAKRYRTERHTVCRYTVSF